jgi:complement component 1 Q subcomponent-binding protein
MTMSHLIRSSRVMRSAARSCVRSTNGASFSAVQFQARPYPGNQSSPIASLRSFSAESAGQDLSDILAREYAEEIENSSAGMPAELQELKTTLEQDWKIVDDGALTKMYRTLGAIKVQVSFHCQDAVQGFDFAAEEGEEAEDEAEAAAPVRFTLTATKAGKTLVLTCLSEDATVRIQSAAITTEDIEEIQKNAGVGSSQYQGPDFTELAEDLQDAFHGYLEEDVGMNEDVASFVAMYADYKEQTQYVQFLKDATALLVE